MKDRSENLIITITGDNSVWTRNSVKDLFNTIILGFLVVVLVLMFFMGVDNALFVAVAIPLSMLIAFIFIPVGFYHEHGCFDGLYTGIGYCC
jgi:multidrug efflux pump